ncbi:GIY-YIG nuclease family protein [Schaalia vaccimaxillae]|uniref:GIY-YIG nuclease family protein n=1 Tax=Schaalia vaccimaxillae TaxID=183916 RepID=UPI00311CB62A
MAPLGVTTVPDITVLGEPVPHSRRRRSSMADGLPASPGVYRFLDEDANPLYIGSATSLESRVRSYFTGAEKRRKIQRMVDLAAQVEYSICSTVLEARVLELRQIRYLRPIFNSASTRQDSQHWLTLDSQRLEVVSRLPQSALGKALGPFGTRHHDETARNGILMACMPSTFGVHTNAALVLSDSQFEWVSAVLQGQHCGVVDELESAMSVASRAGNYEGAARIRERLSAYSTGIQRQDLTVNLMGPQK